jgi:hypothetical protein
MKKLILIINPNDVKKSRTHLSTLEGEYILPNVYKILVENSEIESSIHSFEYILAGLDFHVIVNNVFSKN